MRKGKMAGLQGWYRGLGDRDRRALGLGGIVLIPVVLWLGAVRPYLSSLEDLRDRTESERSLLEREKQVLSDSASYASRLSAATKALNHWEGRLIRSPNLALAEAQVSALLEGIGRESRVLLQEVRATPTPRGAPAPPAGLQAIRMSVSGEGDFAGVLSFLRGVESEKLFLRVIGVSVDRAGGRGGGTDARGAGGPAALSFMVVIEAYAPAETASAVPASGTYPAGQTSTNSGGV